MRDQLWGSSYSKYGLVVTAAGMLAKVSILLLVLQLGACRSIDEPEPDNGYPAEIAPILEQRCANSGCHTTQSAEAAGGLNLETWEDMYQGSRGGSPVVPYSPDLSFLLYAVNTDAQQGPVLLPTMPVGQPPLNASEYQTLRAWIANGARNAHGEERFPPTLDRDKWYVAIKGCDLVAVIDAESRQVMRYLNVGDNIGAPDFPRSLTLSRDGRRLYIGFDYFSYRVAVYDTGDDTQLPDITLPGNGWNSQCISADGRWLALAAEQLRKMAIIDLSNGTVVQAAYPFGQEIHGPAIHPSSSTVLVPSNYLSALYKMDLGSDGSLSNQRGVDLVQGHLPDIPGELAPYSVIYNQDGSQYMVACLHSNEIRILSSANDSLLHVIGVGDFPTDMALTSDGQFLLVSCQLDSSTVSVDYSRRGSVAVVYLPQARLLGTIPTGAQPAGIAIDSKRSLAVVAHRNFLGSPSSQHHAGTCAGINGYVRLIDLQRMQLLDTYKPELAVDPIAIAVKD